MPAACGAGASWQSYLDILNFRPLLDDDFALERLITVDMNGEGRWTNDACAMDGPGIVCTELHAAPSNTAKADLGKTGHCTASMDRQP
jgi:hypothetical protein